MDGSSVVPVDVVVRRKAMLFCRHIIIGLLFVVVVLYNMALLRTYQYDGGVVARRLTTSES